MKAKIRRQAVDSAEAKRLIAELYAKFGIHRR
jgi:hypothetical protein